MLLDLEDLPVSEEDREALRRLRHFAPGAIFAGIQALADAYPELESRARTRPTFAGREAFELFSPPQSGAEGSPGQKASYRFFASP